MNSGGNAPPPSDSNGGEFLLSLLQRPKYQNTHRFQPQTHSSSPPPPPPAQPSHQPPQPVVLDPAVGPTLPFPLPSSWPSNGQDLPHHPHWPVRLGVSPPFPSNGFLGFPHNLFPPPGNQIPANPSSDDFRRLGFPGSNSMVQNLVHQNHELEHKLNFGSFTSDIRVPEELSNGLDRMADWIRILMRTTPPPGFPSRPIGGAGGGGNWDSANRDRGRGLNHNVDREKISSDEFVSNRDVFSAEAVRIRGDKFNGLGLRAQLDRPGPPSGSSLHSVSVSDVEDSFMNLENGNFEVRDGHRQQLPVGAGEREIDDIGERLVGSLLIEEESDDKNESKQHQHSREKVNLFTILGCCFIVHVILFKGF
ncbi:hypothetical protein FEM48_Zijuj12G0129100 [Ziziphus jujuba var. spinosa]|uniref:Uncharacterized protein n=1 Tax=Ziziphus jujuba var. spinosa TaxID=714518 RepID=A0A978UDG3_ZIZJJ|nr:hypothetical protein FEM48_Zijuj12G0129100 [Ziziphus jujuba var. spinosa]